MANEYTPTVNATAQLAAAVSSVLAPPNKASIVLAPLCSSVDATGFPSLVVKIPQPTDMTAASAATYGTALSSNDSLGFDTAFDPKADSKTEQHGIAVVVDKKSDLFLDGTTLDFHDAIDKRGFTFNNPNAKKTCG